MRDDAADNDPLLAPLLSRKPTDQALRDLLMGHAAPLVDSMLDQELGTRGPASGSAAEEVRAEVMMRLVRKLRRLIAAPAVEPIPRFARYVRTVTHSALRDREQREQPQLARLANRVRYLVTHTRKLALWGNDPVCGLVAEEGREDTVPVVTPGPIATRDLEDGRRLRAVVLGVLAASGGPVKLRALVIALAGAGELPRRPFVPSAVLAGRSLDADVQASLESREYLERLWSEIAALPLRQRWSLLLQLRLEEGESVLHVLPALGIAGMRGLAETLAMSHAELLELWNALPLGDQQIAAMLGVSRQQVINLRKAARERLARRLGRPR